MNDANHKMDIFLTYPFGLFDGRKDVYVRNYAYTDVGNNVRTVRDTTVMLGAEIKVG